MPKPKTPDRYIVARTPLKRSELCNIIEHLGDAIFERDRHIADLEWQLYGGKRTSVTRIVITHKDPSTDPQSML